MSAEPITLGGEPNEPSNPRQPREPNPPVGRHQPSHGSAPQSQVGTRLRGPEISEDAKNQILRATLRAPTAGNMMLYSIIEVKDQSAKDTLAKTCDNQPFIARAPLVLLFLADYQRWWDYFKVSGVEALARERGEAVRRPQRAIS